MSSCESWVEASSLVLCYCVAFLRCQGGTKKHKVGKEQPAANSISGEDVLVAAQAVVPGGTSFQAPRDR